MLGKNVTDVDKDKEVDDDRNEKDSTELEKEI